MSARIKKRYQCSTIRKEGGSACPSARPAPIAQRESALAELLLQELRRNPPDWESELRELRADCERLRHELEMRVADLDRRYENLLAAVEAGITTSRIYERMRELDQLKGEAAAYADPALNLLKSLPRGFDR